MRTETQYFPAIVMRERGDFGAWVALAKVSNERKHKDDVANAALVKEENPHPGIWTTVGGLVKRASNCSIQCKFAIAALKQCRRPLSGDRLRDRSSAAQSISGRNDMLKRLMQSLVISALIVAGAIALSSSAQTSGTGSSSAGYAAGGAKSHPDGGHKGHADGGAHKGM